LFVDVFAHFSPRGLVVCRLKRNKGARFKVENFSVNSLCPVPRMLQRDSAGT
jgi:hypothetical protein